MDDDDKLIKQIESDQRFFSAIKGLNQFTWLIHREYQARREAQFSNPSLHLWEKIKQWMIIKNLKRLWQGVFQLLKKYLKERKK